MGTDRLAETYLLAHTPYFGEIIHFSEDAFVEVFPGIRIFFFGELSTEQLREKCIDELIFHQVKIAEIQSKRSSFDAVCEVQISIDELQSFLEEIGYQQSIDIGIEEMRAMFTGFSLLLNTEVPMRRILSLDPSSYFFDNSGIIEEVRWVGDKQVYPIWDDDELDSEVIDIDHYHTYQSWTWLLGQIILDPSRGSSKLVRFLTYCSIGIHAENAFQRLMSYWSGIESLFGFSNSIAANLRQYIPLICYYEDYETEPPDLLHHIEQCIKNCGLLRNVYAHGNKAKSKHFNMIRDTITEVEMLILKILMGIIEIGYVPNQEQLHKCWLNSKPSYYSFLKEADEISDLPLGGLLGSEEFTYYASIDAINYRYCKFYNYDDGIIDKYRKKMDEKKSNS